MISSAVAMWNPSWGNLAYRGQNAIGACAQSGFGKFRIGAGDGGFVACLRFFSSADALQEVVTRTRSGVRAGVHWSVHATSIRGVADTSDKGAMPLFT